MPLNMRTSKHRVKERSAAEAVACKSAAPSVGGAGACEIRVQNSADIATPKPPPAPPHPLNRRTSRLFICFSCIFCTTVFSSTFGLGLYAEKCRTLPQKPPGGTSKSSQNGARSRFYNGPSRHMAKKTQRGASLEGRTCFLHTPVQSKHVFLFSNSAC